MASEIRVNQIQNRSGLGTVTFSDTGVIISGVTTISDLRTSGGALTVGTGASISSPATNVLTLGTNNAERVRITSDGYARLIPANARLEWTASSGSNPFIRSIGSGQQELEFNTSGNEAARFTTAGNLKFPSGQGIDFSATANSSGTMTSELLSDYEEGTFTPRWGSGSSAYSSPAPTYVSQSGYYTKIGNVVYYDIQIETSAWNGAGSTLWAYGLPFTTNSSGYRQGGGGIFCISGVDSANAISNLTTQIAPNTTRVELYYQTAAVGANYNTFSTNEISETAAVSIRISGFYYT